MCCIVFSVYYVVCVVFCVFVLMFSVVACGGLGRCVWRGTADQTPDAAQSAALQHCSTAALQHRVIITSAADLITTICTTV